MYCYLVLVLVLVWKMPVLVLVLVLTLLVLALVSVSELPVLTTRLEDTTYQRAIPAEPGPSSELGTDDMRLQDCALH